MHWRGVDRPQNFRFFELFLWSRPLPWRKRPLVDSHAGHHCTARPTCAVPAPAKPKDFLTHLVTRMLGGVTQVALSVAALAAPGALLVQLASSTAERQRRAAAQGLLGSSSTNCGRPYTVRGIGSLAYCAAMYFGGCKQRHGQH